MIIGLGRDLRSALNVITSGSSGLITKSGERNRHSMTDPIEDIGRNYPEFPGMYPDQDYGWKYRPHKEKGLKSGGTR
jgi:hypothetical protein